MANSFKVKYKNTRTSSTIKSLESRQRRRSGVLIVKVASVVNIKLFFMDWFYCNLILLIKNAKSYTKT